MTDAIKEECRAMLNDVLRPYRGEAIAINLLEPGRMLPLKLIDVASDFFTVADYSGLYHHVPAARVLSVTTAPAGETLKVQNFAKEVRARVGVQLQHQVGGGGGSSWFVGFAVGG